jgi:hephaestin
MRRVLLSLFGVALLFGAFARPAQATVRTYYIAADEIVWNYAPSGRDLISGNPLPPLAPKQLGWTYHKAAYREYTDATFKHLKPRPPSEAYLGFFGPIVHAEVGDTIVIYFKNNTRFHMSVHSHGMLYDKASEGALYQDGAHDKLGDAVPPGAEFTYTWKVPERSGPGPGDPSSVMWMFHSHTDEIRDVNTGPVGAIVITRRGMANPDGTPKDVDREMFAFFAEEDESSSRYLPLNIADPKINPLKRKPVGPALPDDEMYTINGYVFGNMPIPTMRVGQRVRWYVATTMSDFDFHTPHWHGNTVLISGMRTDITDLSPMEMKTADMVPDAPGIWLFHCHVNLHLMAGMEARYEVLK